MADVTLIGSVGENQTFGGQPFVWFDAQQVLMTYYASNPDMQTLVMTAQVNLASVNGYYSTADFEGIDLYWDCFSSSFTDYASIANYLAGFAYAYFGSLNGGTLVRPCVNPGAGSAEDDPDYLLAYMDFQEFAQPQLEVNLSAADIISALEGATSGEIAQIQTLLNVPNLSTDLTAADLLAALAIGDASTLIGIDTTLGVPTTLDPEAVEAWVQDVTDFSPGTWCPAVEDILTGPVNPLVIEAIAAPELTATQVVIAGATGACLKIALEMGDDILNSCMCGVYSLAIPGCGGSSTLVPIPELQMKDPIDPSTTYHLGDALQAILNLVSLTSTNRDCCGFSVDWINPQDFAWNFTDVLYNFQGSARAIYVEIVANDSPARINWQPPEGGVTGGVQRFGKLVFQYSDGTQGPVMFFNTNKQIFSVPDNEITGCQIYLNEGVEASVLQSGYPLWPGTTFPLVN